MEKIRTNSIKKIRALAASAIDNDIVHADTRGLHPGERIVSACEATSLLAEWQYDTPGGRYGKTAGIMTRSDGARELILWFNNNRTLAFKLPA